MSSVVWHDLECGRYEQDLPLWCALAERHVPADAALLDVGAGTGRVTLSLAQRGHRVVALDRDGDLLDELARRATGLDVRTVCADARTFSIAGERFPLVLVPMQTIQLLGGDRGRAAFLANVREHLAPDGVVAAAIASSEHFEEFEWREGDGAPLPDVTEVAGTSYFSQPTAVRRRGDAYVLERRRDAVDAAGRHERSLDTVTLDDVSVQGLQEAGQRAGLQPVTVLEVAPTSEHVGSQVVVLGV